ncbi:DUF1515 domain-containing protein [Roseicitreum antarcticum]|uniref:DUF1515 domain-containing protein n=1 Tax=Roseicitreum antarcticum TaxID=564137 RepID=A0A1H2WE82_9RHOB|nr:DUF1515 domain-containing protein [Roseicitreum antarcticum]SDW78786.1 Protein of unknown function [Roseicitreum antarcticum]
MSSDPETHLRLGQLQGSLESIQRQLDAADAKAGENRAQVHQSLEALRADAQDTRARTAAVERTLQEDVIPVVRSVNDWRSRALGGMIVLGTVGTLVLFVLTMAKEAIIDLWRILLR